MNTVSVFEHGSDKTEQSAPLEKLIMNREFCIWVVPPKNGRVRKIRLSWRHLFCSTVAVSAFAAVFFLIAGDYVRVQAQRAKNYLMFKSVNSQLESAKTHNKQLSSQLDSFSQTQKRLAKYESDVRRKIDELGSMLEAATTIGLIDHIEQDAAVVQAKKSQERKSHGAVAVARSSGNNSKGIGGLELDCSGMGVEGCIDALSEMELLPDTTALKVLKGDQVPADRLVGTLTSYIELVKRIPLGYPVSGEISSGFGFRLSPFSGKPKLHQGVDFSLPRGSYIYATAYGTVEKVERSGTYGLKVDIRHGPGIMTRYAHLSRIMVKEGQQMKRGEIVGHVGSTGRSTGPHLHYEVRIANKAKNPNKFMDLAYNLKAIL